MTLKRYKLPNGVLYVNTSSSTIEHIIDNGVPTKILPKKAHLAGDMKGLPLEEYFASPEIWDAKWQVCQAVEKKGKTTVVIDAKRVSKCGDQIMLTVLPKAYKETWGDKAQVDVVVPKIYLDVWKHNPHVRSVSVEVNGEMKYDKVLDVTTLGLKFRRKVKEHCADMIVHGLGLTLINKTPVLVLTDEEKDWAEQELKRLKKTSRPIIGVSIYSAVKSRTYPHMIEATIALKNKGYSIVLLDDKQKNDEYKYTFRQSAALVGECDLILTADSAILHVAGALGKRVVALFGYTEGVVFTESYEKARPLQAPCPYDKKPCWWEMDCIKGPRDHLARTNLEHAHCLRELKSDVVVKAVEDQFILPKKLLLVMLTYNALEMTKKAVESIRSYHNYELFVVDNQSNDGTQAWLKEKEIEFVSVRTSVAGAQNIGIERFKKGDYDHIIFLNNDIVMRFDCLDQLVSCAEKSEAFGVMSTQLAGASWKMDSLQPKDTKWEIIKEIPAGSYSCTLFTKKCIETVGTFNERFKPRYIEDNCYTLRIRALGGKFVKAHGALFWHFLGVVIKTVEKAKGATHTDYWWNNIGVFKEMYGFAPHEKQDLKRLGLEWRKRDLAEEIGKFIKAGGKKPRVVIRRSMGGYGDILFTTVVAKALRYLFPKSVVEIVYHVPEKFISLLNKNPNIDEVCVGDTSDRDFTVNLTDVEFRAELQEMRKYGEIKSARTEIYLDVLGLDKHLPKKGDWLKPDYHVTEGEKAFGESIWHSLYDNVKVENLEAESPHDEKRIVVIQKGSNMLKHWPYCKELIAKLKTHKMWDVMVLDEESGQVKYDFRKAASIVSVSDLVISPDSGISNLAGALGVPILTIFSNRNGKNFTKMFSSMIPIQGFCPHREQDYCDFFCPCLGAGPHRKKENKVVPDCLKKLKADLVYEVVKEVL